MFIKTGRGVLPIFLIEILGDFVQMLDNSLKRLKTLLKPQTRNHAYLVLRVPRQLRQPC